MKKSNRLLLVMSVLSVGALHAADPGKKTTAGKDTGLYSVTTAAGVPEIREENPDGSITILRIPLADLEARPVDPDVAASLAAATRWTGQRVVGTRTEMERVAEVIKAAGGVDDTEAKVAEEVDAGLIGFEAEFARSLRARNTRKSAASKNKQ